MDVLVFCVVLLALTAFVARPLYERAKSPSSTDRREIEAEHEVVVRALSDLEIDHASGALDEATYAAERASLEDRGTQTLHRLDEPND
jgi:cytochrome c-type biogenesis protein CcmI